MNPYKTLLQLIPGQPTDTGTVLSADSGGAIVELLTGAQVSVKGDAVIGERVYIKGGTIIGPAPDLSGVDVEV